MIRALITALIFLGALPAAARDCRLALLLAFDVSSSVDPDEHALQRNGTAAALLSPEVLDPLLNGPGPVAISVYEWSGRFQQTMIAPWQMIETEQDLMPIIRALQTVPRVSEEHPTAIGYAIGYAAQLFADAPPCLFQTLDIAGDGENNDGFPPHLAYDHFPLYGVTVNGLAIGGSGPDIFDYYQRHVIHGPGSFVEFAASHEDFEDAIRRKLERELRVMTLGQLETRPIGGQGG